LDGRPLRPPVDLAAQPNVEALRDHRLACCSGGAASSCAAVRRSPALRDEGR
jgi:hypothetical protein